MHNIVYQICWDVRRGRTFPFRAQKVFERQLRLLCLRRDWELQKLTIEGATVTVTVRANEFTTARTVWFILTKYSVSILRERFHEFRTLPSVWTLRYTARTITPEEERDAQSEVQEVTA